jgi:curved DNA-binding protein CbpA
VPTPYEILGIKPEAEDAEIRARYLELIKQYTPEHSPQKFAAIRDAYEKLKDLETRVQQRLFGYDRHLSFDEIIEEYVCRMPRRRIPLKDFLAMPPIRIY